MRGLCTLIITSVLCAVAPAAANAQATDVAAMIRQATAVHARTQGPLAVDAGTAMARMDAVLVEQYGIRGALASEPSANLKAAYLQAATLIMNGYGVAGGLVIKASAQSPAFAGSRAGPALLQFVDAMYAPTGDADDLLTVLAERAVHVRDRLAAQVSAESVPAAQWLVMGRLYNDPIAEQAGAAALERIGVSAEQIATWREWATPPEGR